MPKFSVKIEILADSPEIVQQIGNLLQNTVNVTEQGDLIRLLSKVKESPGIVKKALKFI